ncbi:MAG: hypothetical protein LBN21_12910 [Treponema sp.]|nr:hypothetical protein [Treponema sp.]
MEKIQEIVGDRGVVHPGHPPIVGSPLIAAGHTYQAGTLLKAAADGYVAARDAVTGEGAAPADQADCVLIQDTDTTDGAKPGLCLHHGMVVLARLLNSFGSGDPVPAGDAMIATLVNRGIYAVQDFDYSVMA